jgi:hypothetical protein
VETPAPARPAEPQPVSAAASELAESAVSARGPRRRRGRGRRGRAAAGTPTGAEAEAGVFTPPEHPFGQDTDEADEGDEDVALEAAEERAAEPPAAPQPQPAPEPSRPTFSLFSWIRGEPHHPEGSEPDPPDTERKPGER